MKNQTYNFLDNHNLLPETTRFYFIRHAIVNEKDRNSLYGTNDVSICPTYLNPQLPIYKTLANNLPQTRHWFITSLSRTRDTALQIQKAGYGDQTLKIEDAFLEQNLGNWQGLPHHKVNQLQHFPSHPFWPFSAVETPPNGESMEHVYQRVRLKLEAFSKQYHNENIIIVSHGGTIRAALAYSLQIPVETALSFSIYNLSLTILEKHKENWRVITVNNKHN